MIRYRPASSRYGMYIKSDKFARLSDYNKGLWLPGVNPAYFCHLMGFRLHSERTISYK